MIRQNRPTNHSQQTELHRKTKLGSHANNNQVTVHKTQSINQTHTKPKTRANTKPIIVNRFDTSDQKMNLEMTQISNPNRLGNRKRVNQREKAAGQMIVYPTAELKPQSGCSWLISRSPRVVPG